MNELKCTCRHSGGTELVVDCPVHSELGSGVSAIPTLTLPSLLSGDHNDLLRELAAKSVGLTPILGQWRQPIYDCRGRVVELPSYHSSLDACVELRAALAYEEKIKFNAILSRIVKEFKWEAKPIELLVSFLLTRNLITLK